MKGCHAGVPLSVTPERAAEFWALVQKRDGACWQFTGATLNGGYGTFRLDGQQRLAHRVAYTIARGPIPPGMLVMHTCDDPGCVNPDHLWIGTQADNLRDMYRKGRQGDHRAAAKKRHARFCVRGHRKTENNTRKDGDRLICLTCERLNAEHAAQRSAQESRAHALSVQEDVAAVAREFFESIAHLSYQELVFAVGRPRDADVFARYFGLHGYRHYALDEIALEYSITRERVRQLRNRAMQNLGLDVKSVMAAMPQPFRTTMETAEKLTA